MSTQQLRSAEITLKIESADGMRIEVVTTVGEDELARILEILSEGSDGRE